MSEFVFLDKNNKQVVFNSNPTELNITMEDSLGNKFYPKTKAERVLFDDGETFQQKLDNGELKGEKGDQGIQGERGATGPQGPAGATGATGPKGADGLTTSISVNGQTYEQVDGNITLPNFQEYQITKSSGMGTRIDNEDLNTKLDTGLYYGIGIKNTPLNAGGWFQVEVFRSSVNFIIQRACYIGYSTHFIRTSNTGGETFTEWQQISCLTHTKLWNGSQNIHKVNWTLTDDYKKYNYLIFNIGSVSGGRNSSYVVYPFNMPNKLRTVEEYFFKHFVLGVGDVLIYMKTNEDGTIYTEIRKITDNTAYGTEPVSWDGNYVNLRYIMGVSL